MFGVVGQRPLKQLNGAASMSGAHVWTSESAGRVVDISIHPLKFLASAIKNMPGLSNRAAPAQSAGARTSTKLAASSDKEGTVGLSGALEAARSTASSVKDLTHQMNKRAHA